MAPLNSAGSTLWGLVAATVVLSATVFEIWTRKVEISIISAEKGFKVTQGHRSWCHSKEHIDPEQPDARFKIPTANFY